MPCSCGSNAIFPTNIDPNSFVNINGTGLGCCRPCWNPCWNPCPITPCPPVPPPLCSVTTGTATAVTATDATIIGNQFSTACAAVTQVGVEYCNNPNFTCMLTSAGTLTSPFSAQLTSLTPGTLYYYRAFADTSCGRVFGQVMTFTTSPTPTVITGAATAITSTTATIAGNVYSGIPGIVGGVGVLYSTSPTMMPSQAATGTIGQPFSVPLTGLTPATTYYYRAYVDSNGSRYLGNILNFTTTAI